MNYNHHTEGGLTKPDYIKYLESEIEKLEVKSSQTRFDRVVIDLVKEHLKTIK